jgi:hypothetical protein
MCNASRNDNYIAARDNFFDATWVVLVPEAQSGFAICNSEDFM